MTRRDGDITPEVANKTTHRPGGLACRNASNGRALTWSGFMRIGFVCRSSQHDDYPRTHARVLPSVKDKSHPARVQDLLYEGGLPVDIDSR